MYLNENPYSNEENKMQLEKTKNLTIHKAIAQKNTEEEIKINTAINNGLFVVISEQPAYCDSTNTICGTYKRLRSTHKNRDNADIAAEENIDSEEMTYVLPETPIETIEQTTYNDDEIPF